MTLPKFIKRGQNSSQLEQKRADDDEATMAPKVKHVDLLTDRGSEEIGNTPLEIDKAPRETNPQSRVCPVCKSKICRCNNKF